MSHLGLSTIERASAPQLVMPLDGANTDLLAHVHPPDWRNPDGQGVYDLVVIGGGTAGLVSALGAAGLGARVALIERARRRRSSGRRGSWARPGARRLWA
jgi:NADPH-dependent 2,4-dienoyl-CoA reductase/sulfur reductase-like enzyme